MAGARPAPDLLARVDGWINAHLGPRLMAAVMHGCSAVMLACVWFLAADPVADVGARLSGVFRLVIVAAALSDEWPGGLPQRPHDWAGAAALCLQGAAMRAFYDAARVAAPGERAALLAWTVALSAVDPLVPSPVSWLLEKTRPHRRTL